MSTTTPKLGLFKYDTTTDGKEVFSIQTALNNNWDILDNLDAFPDQTGKAGCLLTTDGTTVSWGDTDLVHCIVETYIDGNSWYRIYSDNWCEQGGLATLNTEGYGTVVFLKPFTSTNYCFLCQPGLRSDSSAWHVYPTDSYTPNQYTLRANLTGHTLYSRWLALGYIS